MGPSSASRRFVGSATAAMAALSMAIACGGGERRVRAEREALQQRLQADAPAELGSRRDALWKMARRHYQLSGHRLIWVEDGPTEMAEDLLRTIEGSSAEGLNPADYDLRAAALLEVKDRSWNPLRKKRLPPAQAAEAEVRFTAAFLKLASDMLTGRVHPNQVDPHWFGQYRLVALDRVLQRAVEKKRVQRTLQELVPQHAQYVTLRQALQRYREIAARGGWPSGFAGKQAPAEAVRARLAAEGDLPSSATAQPVSQRGSDPVLRQALMRFEKRHGFAEDGRLDAEVLRAMDVPVAQRIRQIELNLERWRWLPEALGERYIIVNVPSYSLSAIEQGKVTLGMRVVTGTVKDPTPIFSDRMTHVIFSPYWNVPPSIAREEILPALERDPAYLYKNDMEVVSGSRVVSPWSVDWSSEGFTVRQRPGPRNALGGVKFVFPNNFNVYLHDTPADRLFASTDRSFSHGCVRVEKPLELAQWVLRGQPEWTADRIQAAMHSGQEKHVVIKDPIPVYLTYATAWVEADGAVSFRDDIYGHDQRQLKLLPPSPPPARLALAAQPRSGGAGQ